LCLDCANNLFSFIQAFCTYTKLKINNPSYHRYYSLMPSGGLLMTEEGTCDASESEATRTQVQRAST
jgi:hypothetical protein